MFGVVLLGVVPFGVVLLGVVASSDDQLPNPLFIGGVWEADACVTFSEGDGGRGGTYDREQRVGFGL